MNVYDLLPKSFLVSGVNAINNFLHGLEVAVMLELVALHSSHLLVQVLTVLAVWVTAFSSERVG